MTDKRRVAFASNELIDTFVEGRDRYSRDDGLMSLQREKNEEGLVEMEKVLLNGKE